MFRLDRVYFPYLMLAVFKLWLMNEITCLKHVKIILRRRGVKHARHIEVAPSPRRVCPGALSRSPPSRFPSSRLVETSWFF